MAGGVKFSASMGTVMVCALGVVQCASPAPRVAHRSPGVVAHPMPVPRMSSVRPKVSAPQSVSASAPMSGCSALLDRYKHEAAHIPYPANLPIRPLLGVGDQLVARFDPLGQDRGCQALLRMTLDRFFVRSLGPGVAPAPKLPVARVD